MPERPAAIRKAAILVTALDERSAESLLGQMGTEMAARVRNAMMELDDIPAAEQEAVLAEFLRGKLGRPAADEGVELELSSQVEPARSVDRNLEHPSAASTESPDSAGHFGFLATVPPRQVAEALSREQPQTISVVVAQLEAAVAAQILESLAPDLATDVLERMAWLDEPADDVLQVIEQQLRRTLAPWLAGDRGGKGLAGLQAVLGAMDQSARGRVLAGLAQKNRSLSKQLGAAADDRPTAGHSVASFRYRLAAPEFPAQSRYPQASDDSSLVDFDDFAALEDDALRRIFAAADPEVALLALTGADEALLSRITRQLPARGAAALRSRLNHPGAIRLRDIELARQHLADLARQLAAEGRIVLPGSRHFAAAV
ncbi:MAG: FliG C-terminal domain-containing protein [Pirellulaceae bacterium]|nr:FliG C-terminal domain-containing protein [Pirellulaceae bacterium]